MIMSNARRFEKILHRKRRFLLFPPGSAIVVGIFRSIAFLIHCYILCNYFVLQTTMSFTKTLVPTSPSGINMIAECDIFYPLQTKISDWYPTTKKPPRPPPPPPPPEADYEDNAAQNTPESANPQAPHPPQPPSPQPPSQLPPAMNDFPSPPDPSAPTTTNGQQDANDANGQFKFPTDQELGISAGTLINDPNFNVGKHPGEIYVDNGMSMRRRDPTVFVGNYANGPKSLYKNVRK